MQLDLKKRPLGQYLSRHLLFEEWDPQGKGWTKGLYLALAQETTSMFANTVDRSAGFIRLEPTVNGQPADYTVSADPSCAKIACAGGGNLTVALVLPVHRVRQFPRLQPLPHRALMPVFFRLLSFV